AFTSFLRWCPFQSASDSVYLLSTLFSRISPTLVFVFNGVGKVRNHEHFTFPTPLKTKTRVGDILEKSVDNKYTLSDALWNGH
ncbi:hypothetical protein QJA14_25640, partial [Escherichia coli]